MKTTKLLILLALALSLMACTFSVNVPEVKTGQTRTFEVSEASPPAEEVSSIKIEMGAGSLNLSGGADKLVEGTITYNIDSWKPGVTRQGNAVTIKQSTSTSVAIPADTYKNSWDLKLGSTPIELTLATGAYEGDLELGGLAITALSVTDGASKSIIRFNEPNAANLEQFSYKTGASDVRLEGLGNARASHIEFNGGVGRYTLDFSGINDNDIAVKMDCGMSDITLVIPENVRSIITINGEMNNTNFTGTWTVKDNVYQSGTAGALIEIEIDMSVGNLNLIRHE